MPHLVCHHCRQFVRVEEGEGLGRDENDGPVVEADKGRTEVDDLHRDGTGVGAIIQNSLSGRGVSGRPFRWRASPLPWRGRLAMTFARDAASSGGSSKVLEECVDRLVAVAVEERQHLPARPFAIRLSICPRRQRESAKTVNASTNAVSRCPIDHLRVRGGTEPRLDQLGRRARRKSLERDRNAEDFSKSGLRAF